MAKKDISKFYTDEHITRLVALQVVIILLLVLLGHTTYLIFILTLDFAIRAFTTLPSPLAFIAKSIAKLTHLQPKPIFAAPKKFAAAIGFVFSLAASILLVFHFTKAAYVLSGILVLFAFLEAAFKICVGCYIYDWLVAPIVNKKESINIQK